MVSFRRRQLRARDAAGWAAPVTIAIEAGLPRQAVHGQAPRGVRPESATGKQFLKKSTDKVYKVLGISTVHVDYDISSMTNIAPGVVFACESISNTEREVLCVWRGEQCIPAYNTIMVHE